MPPSTPESRLERFERIISVTKETCLLAGGLILAIYLLPALGDIRDRLSAKNIESLSFAGIDVKLKQDITHYAPANVPLDAIAGPAEIIEKGSPDFLDQVRSRLQASKGGRIDVILIRPDKQYNGGMLQRYVSLLNAKFVVFESTTLDGWIDAGGFAAQLTGYNNYSYDELLHSLVGIDHTSVNLKEKTKNVLEKMQASHIDNIAVVDEQNHFKFFVNRQDVLSKIVTSVVLAD